MNLWQMMMARRGLMDVAGKEELGGGGGGGEPTKDQPGEQPGGEGGDHDPGTDDAHKQARQPELDDEYAGLSQEELIAKLRDAKKSGAELLKESMKRKEKLAAYGDIDPERARRLVDAEAAAERTRQEAEQAELERRGEFDAVKKQMVAAHQADLQVERDARTQVEAENATLKAQLLEMTVGASFSGSGFLRDKALMTPAKARVIYGNHFEVSEDGSVVGYDKPAGQKDRAVLVDGHGQPLAFESAIERILRADPEADALLRSEAKPGAGSQSKPSAKVTTPVNKSTIDKLTAGLGKIVTK